MNNQIIARVRLGRGKNAFFDKYTRIHLGIANPEANILAGMNTTGIKRAIAYNTLYLISGSLDTVSTNKIEDNKAYFYAAPPISQQTDQQTINNNVPSNTQKVEDTNKKGTVNIDTTKTEVKTDTKNNKAKEEDTKSDNSKKKTTKTSPTNSTSDKDKTK